MHANPAISAGGMWVKGNTHTHTNVSDGDAPPAEVIEWYKSHGYNFLMLTDHNKRIDPEEYKSFVSDNFILIPGEELTTYSEGKPIHINALGLSEAIQPEGKSNITETIQWNIDAILKAKALPQVNHPNFGYAFGHREMEQVENFNLLEIFNGHPLVNNAGDSAHLPVEQMWDVLLSSGRTIYGLAVDDTHDYRESSGDKANPGRGWIMVKVNKLTPSEVLDGIRKGNFYASTGVELNDYTFDGETVHVSIKPAEGITYTTRFTGKYGRILSEVDGTEAFYKLTGKPSEAYVRAKVIASDGKVAWIQPERQGLRTED